MKTWNVEKLHVFTYGKSLVTEYVYYCNENLQNEMSDKETVANHAKQLDSN